MSMRHVNHSLMANGKSLGHRSSIYTIILPSISLHSSKTSFSLNSLTFSDLTGCSKHSYLSPEAHPGCRLQALSQLCPTEAEGQGEGRAPDIPLLMQSSCLQDWGLFMPGTLHLSSSFLANLSSRAVVFKPDWSLDSDPLSESLRDEPKIFVFTKLWWLSQEAENPGTSALESWVVQHERRSKVCLPKQK